IHSMKFIGTTDSTGAAVDDFTFNSPVSSIDYLAALVMSYSLPGGIEKSLVVKLNAASTNLNAGAAAPACEELEDFISESDAQKGKKLTESQAYALISAAAAIRAEICP